MPSIAQRIVCVALSGFLITSGPTAVSADSICGPGMELSSNAFACVPAYSGGSGNNGVEDLANGLSAAAAILGMLDALAKEPAQGSATKPFKRATAITRPLPESAKVNTARLKAARDYEETCLKQDRATQEATLCVQISAKMLRAVGQEAEASMVEAMFRDQPARIEIDPGCNSHYPTVAEGDICVADDPNNSSMMIKHNGRSVCCVTADYGRELGLSTPILSLRDQIISGSD